jgi:alkylation response protein AidB-like acyl-CoA dehydrogenase
MSPFAVDKRDIQFCLFEYLQIENLCKLPKYTEFNREVFEMVIDEASKYAAGVLAPLNTILDREGIQFDKGKVSMPAECHKAYKSFCEGGWVSASGDPEFGGQGMPLTMNTAVTEIQGTACMPFLLAPGLTHSAGHLIETFCGGEIKKKYLAKLYSGEWTGTMCLTEGGAGSAVGDLKTKAIREDDHYLIEGEKIFISFGEHDLTENIVHLVLARVEGAPKGIRGVSLFLVPKQRLNDDGSVGEFNNVVCGNIEHKMGIHGAPTCTMIFGADGPCRGYLIGEENQGIRHMFQMMNEARIGVGLQGLGAAAASYQEALQYAKERIQGVDMKDMKDVDAPRVAIIKHPDVRRMLMTMKAFVEGMRAMIYYTTLCADTALNSEDEETRNKNKLMLDLLTPICKAYCSDSGFEMTSIGVQVFGGYGYTKEYPVEQYLRDAKIASIYEGTNGIQALDLLGRKVAGKGAASFMTFLSQLNEFIDANSEHSGLGAQVKKIGAARDKLTQTVMKFQQVGSEGDFYYPLLYATPFLEMCGTIAVSYFLCDMALLAEDKLKAIFEKAGVPSDTSSDDEKRKLIAENPEASFYDGKIHSARFFVDVYLPRAHAIADTVMSGNRSPLEVNF